VPFNTQFFNDDYDDGPGFDDVCDFDCMGAPDADAGEQDLLATTAGQMHRVRPEFVYYAKRAKRVDLRKLLKDDTRKGLDVVTAPPPQEIEDGMVRCVLSCTRCAFPDCW
jgi:condensin complex subunit 2